MKNIRLYEIKLPFDHSDRALHREILEKTGVTHQDIQEIKVVKRSLDARPHHKPFFVYCVDVFFHENAPVPSGFYEIHPTDNSFRLGTESLSAHPIVVGAGPAGLFAAFYLAQHGYCPWIIEQGEPIERRVESISNFLTTRRLDPQSNYVFGEGGAGAYSDGKLYTGISSPYILQVLQILVEQGAPPEILYVSPPHIGSDRLRGVIINMRKKIQSRGGTFFFREAVNGMIVEERVFKGVSTQKREILGNVCILAPGSHSEETFCMLCDHQVEMTSKSFQMGVRIEHPQKMIDECLLGRYSGHPLLSPCSYHLVSQKSDCAKQVCSFCMCPGGEIVPATGTPGSLVTNGMSDYKRNSGFANAALVVTLNSEDFGKHHPLDGIGYRKKIEEDAFRRGGGDFTAPAQFATDFLSKKAGKSRWISSYRLGLKEVPLERLLPAVITQSLRVALPQFESKIKGFCSEGILLAPETRASCPVRIPRDQETMQSSSCKNLYPVGEGAGFAGGIVSAAIDGMKAARKIMERFRPFE